jgi:hypothetical protein
VIPKLSEAEQKRFNRQQSARANAKDISFRIMDICEEEALTIEEFGMVINRLIGYYHSMTKEASAVTNIKGLMELAGWNRVELQNLIHEEP